MLRRDFIGLGLSSLASVPLSCVPLSSARAAGTGLPLRNARSCDAVCDAYMINTKLFYKDTIYGRHFDAVVDLLRELGVRIVRERITTSTSIGTGNQQDAMIQLAQHGVRWHGTVGEIEDWRRASTVNREVIRHLATYYRPRVGDLSNLIHSLGGCNEIDGDKVNGHMDPLWAPHGRLMQRALWTAAKAEPATRHLPVAGPSTGTDITRGAAAVLGDLSAWCDIGNGHLYNKGGSPSRDIDAQLSKLSVVFPDADRWIMTETGYNNSPQDNLGRTVPEHASATYAIRAICDYFTRRTVYGRFELLDDPDPIDYSSQASINRTALRDAHFGLVAMTKDTVGASTPDTWRKKPEFYATKRFLHLMADRGPSFTPRPMRLGIAAGTDDLLHQLVQKRDGRHYLLLWRDVEVSTLYPDAQRIRVRPVQVRLSMGTARPIAVYDPRRSEAPVATHSARTQVDVPVAGDVMVVEIG